MRLTSCVLAAPVLLLLSVGGTQAKDQAKGKKNHVDHKTIEKEWKRSTEGHRPQDLNGDGIITRNEWPGNEASFRQLDTDGDGALTNKDRGYGTQGGQTRMYDRPVNDYRTRKRK